MGLKSEVLEEVFLKDFFRPTDENPCFIQIIREWVLNPGYRVVAYYRLAVFLSKISIMNRLGKILGKLIIVRLSRVPGVEIQTRFEIGAGLRLHHPHDIVIGAGVRIGKNVTIYNGVTLGARILRTNDTIKEVDRRYPTVEDGVTIFSGAKIIGPVTIGSNSIVGANSLVNRSCRDKSVIAGVPARFLRMRE